MSLAILCSGQGGQHVAMFELSAQSARATPIFDAASSILGRDIRQWVRSAPDAQLYENPSAQLLCCTQALAAWAALELPGRLSGQEVTLAGYSVGELAAWGCAGLIEPAQILRLAIVRAQAMDRAAGTDTGLAFVRGLTRSALEGLCRAQRCELAIILSDDSFLVGGRREPLSGLIRQALASGAQRSSVLPIGVAAHTSLLSAASAELAPQLRAASSSNQQIKSVRLLSGVDGDVVHDVASGVDKLARQISHMVDWEACLTACRESGVTHVLELGPGRALAHMAHDAIPDARCRSLEEFRSLEGVHAWLHADHGRG